MRPILHANPCRIWGCRIWTHRERVRDHSISARQASRCVSRLGRPRLEGSRRRTGLRPVGRMAQAGPAELGRSKGRHLGDIGHLQSSAEQVGLRLHQQIGRGGPAIGAQGGQRLAVRLDHVDDVAHLVGHRLHGGAGHVGAGAAAGQAVHRGLHRAVPVRRTQSGEGRDHDHAGAAVDLGRERDQVRDVLETEKLGRPGQGRARGQDVALPGKRRLVGQPGQGRRHRRVAPDEGGDRRHHRRTRAVGGLGQARCGAALTEQGGVRIGQHGNDRCPVRDARQVLDLAERPVGSPDLRQHAQRHLEQCAQLRRPGQIDHVVEQGPRGVAGIAGMDPTTGESPGQPCIDGAHGHIVEVQPARRVRQQPTDLRRREHGVDPQSGAPADQRGGLRAGDRRTPFGCPLVLPAQHRADRPYPCSGARRAPTPAGWTEPRPRCPARRPRRTGRPRTARCPRSARRPARPSPAGGRTPPRGPSRWRGPDRPGRPRRALVLVVPWSMDTITRGPACVVTRVSFDGGISGSCRPDLTNGSRLIAYAVVNFYATNSQNRKPPPGGSSDE